MSLPRTCTLAAVATLALTACGSADTGKTTPEASAAAATPAAAPDAAPAASASNVPAVAACSRLTLDDLKAVYPGVTFVVERENNYPPTPYEALSGCRYHIPNVQEFDDIHVDLEIRNTPSAADAAKRVADAKEMDMDKRGKPVPGVGDGAYLIVTGMQNGGPTLAFSKGTVWHKLNIQTIKRGTFPKLEGEIMALSARVLAHP